MNYTDKKIMKSKRAYEILQHFYKNGEDYSSNIAKKMGLKQPYVSEIISVLEKKKAFLKKGKRNKAQYYEINYEGFFEIFFSELKERCDSLLVSDNINVLNHHKKEIKDLIVYYIKNYLSVFDDRTINRMLFEDLFLGLKQYIMKLVGQDSSIEKVKKEVPDFLIPLMTFLMMSTDIPKKSPDTIIQDYFD